MDGAVERSGKSGQANDLAEGAGQTAPLKPKDNFEGRPHLYRAIEETPNGWCMVVGPTVPEHAGPWRYLWEAQEYADEINVVPPFAGCPG